jgi:hypothetical protein
MSMNIGAIALTIPPPVSVATGSAQAGTTAVSPPSPAPRPDSEAEGVTPAPIQPLSNRMLATFLQRDIELYGSMFGA